MKRAAQRTAYGMTLIELLVTLTLLVVVLDPVLRIFAFATRQWGIQSSSTLSMQLATLALDKIEKEVRSAVSFSSVTYSGYTYYTFALPSSKDSSGNYLPVFQSNQGANVENVIGYNAGAQLAYYLSDTTGGLASGTVLWRATAPAGSSSWTADSAWSLNSAGQATYGTVQSFTITPVLDMSGYASSVQINLTVSVTQGSQSRPFTLTRTVYMRNTGL